MTANEYQRLASRTIDWKMDNESMTYHALHGMVGEIGEVHSIFQKVYQGHDMDDEHLKKECGDLLWFVAEFCTARDWSLESVMMGNIEKLKNRYPDGFSAERSLYRQEGDV